LREFQKVDVDSQNKLDLQTSLYATTDINHQATNYDFDAIYCLIDKMHRTSHMRV
jgi:hypothetical protein